MELPTEEIKKRMTELKNDKEFNAKLNQETRRLRGRNLRQYIAKASQLSEKEVRK
jgi:tryptophan synthase beta subunit